ncbi:hypothetical protein KSP39_PZI005925 [Platanthera zijinensis]|uniref:Uncharacterized protein n=1 Tax=Platanthera zijinensis TaxID=2320716 RepID=A0AAP0BT12_9ASPA
MQSRYRSPRDGFRPGSPATSGSRMPPYIRDLDRDTPNPYQFSRKMDILMEAGRLAAGYLVSRGVIPPELLRRKFPNGSPPGFERQGREIPPPPEIRTSALARLGQRFDDEGRFSSRRRDTSRNRPGPYSRVYDSDWGREIDKSRNWIDRGRGYSDLVEEDEFAPGFSRNRRKGYTEIKSSVQRVSVDEQPTRSGSASEKENCELADDNWSKASSSSTKKDQHPEADEGSSRGVDEVRVSSSEITEEAKSEIRDELEKKESMEEDMNSKPSAEEGDAEMRDCKDLLKLCSFSKVPTKPRSSLGNRSPKVHEDPDAEMSEALENDGEEEFKDLNCKGISSSAIHTPENHAHPSNNSLEEDRTIQDNQFQSSVNSGTCIKSLSETQDTVSDHEVDERRKKDNSFPSQVSDTFELTEPLLIGKGSRDKVMVQEAIEVGLNSTAFVPEPKRESSVTMEEVIRHESSASFKICDLNLNGSPEMSDISGGPSVDHFPSAPIVNIDKGVSANLSMPMKNVDNTCDNNQIFVLNKVVPEFDLEEDPHAEPNTFDSSKHKSDISYTGLVGVLNQASHTDDLPGIQDGYSLEFSEFLGSDISVCPSAQGDLHDLQPGIGLHGTEGYPGVDDPIYVSLDELPIGFMGAWDQPSQDYGKFF